jgi:hypothetical protein
MALTRKGNKLQTCFYCDTVFVTSPSAMGDHFPVPRRNSGIETVPCCVTCHNAKDNLRILDWSGNMIASVIADFPKLSAHTRIFLAKTLAIISDINESARDSDEAP